MSVTERYTLSYLPDHSVSTVYCFAPEHASGNDSESGEPGEVAPLVMMWPGFGMGARYYRPLATELASRGFHVAIGELRGQGTNSTKAMPDHQWGYHDLASQDYPRAIEAAKKELSLPRDHPMFLLTHSMGGQVGAMFLARPETHELNVKGLMGVGSGSPYHRGFKGKAHVRALLGGQIMGQVAKMRGIWPGGAFDIAGYGRQSGTHVYEWSRFSRENRIDHLAGQDIDYSAEIKNVSTPVLLTRFANDTECTIESCEYLLGHLAKAPRTAEELPGRLGHNRWAREPRIVADRFELFVADVSH